MSNRCSISSSCPLYVCVCTCCILRSDPLAGGGHQEDVIASFHKLNQGRWRFLIAPPPAPPRPQNAFFPPCYSRSHFKGHGLAIVMCCWDNLDWTPDCTHSSLSINLKIWKMGPIFICLMIAQFKPPREVPCWLNLQSTSLESSVSILGLSLPFLSRD